MKIYSRLYDYERSLFLQPHTGLHYFVVDGYITHVNSDKAQ